MKVPTIIDSFFHKAHPKREVFLSLYIDVHSAAVSFWTLGPRGVPNILENEYTLGIKDSWEARAEAIDRMIGVLEERTGVTEETKVILGLPSTYLTDTGEIRPEIRSQIKELAHVLELTPVGFVPLHQAIIYKLKHDEGVPPSVILLGINHATIAVSVYKIGSLAGLREIEKHEDIALSVERGLKSFTDLEVLPARMLLYGSDAALLEEYKTGLLRHQWTTIVNFLHFPKIEVISNAVIIDSISLAGASELGQSMGDETGEEEPAETAGETKAVPAAVPAVSVPVTEDETDEEEAESEEKPADEHVHVSVAAAPGQEEKEEEVADSKVTQEVGVAQEAIKEDFTPGEVPVADDANVVMVDAQSLGFKKDVDVLEDEEEETEEAESGEKGEDTGRPPITLPSLPTVNISNLFRGLRFPSMKGKSTGVLIGAVVVILLLMFGIYYWFLPHATLTILEIPKTVEASQTVTIDPTATLVDAEHNIIPGKKRETQVSGEKTIPVNGKKDVGDPARGTVTIYNKSEDSLVLKKGAVLSTGSLQFTLDSDVTVASASESIGSLTFGKTTASVTAADIGPGGNVTGGADFTFKNISSSRATAHNDNAFTGGTSKVVTVVSRADTDALVKAVTDELISKANDQLSRQVGGSEKLVDGTITTKVTEKVFNQEVEQPATQLQGKLTLTVSGITISDADVRALLTTLVSDQVPQGYTMNDAKTDVTITDIVVKKDGSMTAKVHISSVAYPAIDTAIIRKSVVGKSLKDAESYLRSVPGVEGVEVSFRFSPTRNRLPVNKNNITVTLSP